jgi:hypothetical protein
VEAAERLREEQTNHEHAKAEADNVCRAPQVEIADGT